MTASEYKSQREQLGTQLEVAELLGVTATTIARRERGEVPLTREMQLAIEHLSRTRKRPQDAKR